MRLPGVRPDLFDAGLSADIKALQELVTMGGAARNKAGVKVRQPLAELRVVPCGDDDERATVRRAVERFADQLRDELNVKAVSLHTDGPLLRETARLNPKTAKQRYKGKPEAAAAELSTANVAALRKQLKADGQVAVLGVGLTDDDLIFETVAPPGWAGVAEPKAEALLDTRITPELKAEGMARDVIRLVQQARKDAGLDVADAIALHLATADADLTAAVTVHWAAIAGEVQATARLDAPPADGYRAEVKVDGRPLTVAVRKV